MSVWVGRILLGLQPLPDWSHCRVGLEGVQEFCLVWLFPNRLGHFIFVRIGLREICCKSAAPYLSWWIMVTRGGRSRNEDLEHQENGSASASSLYGRRLANAHVTCMINGWFCCERGPCKGTLYMLMCNTGDDGQFGSSSQYLTVNQLSRIIYRVSQYAWL